MREIGKAYIAAHEAGWRNDKYRQQWRNTLSTYVYSMIGKLPVQAIDTATVMKILEPIWTAQPETAGRVRGRIESILDWAKIRQFRSGGNPARRNGHLDQLLSRKGKIHKVRHQPAMPYQAVPAGQDLRARGRLVRGRGRLVAGIATARSGRLVPARPQTALRLVR